MNILKKQNLKCQMIGIKKQFTLGTSTILIMFFVNFYKEMKKLTLFTLYLYNGLILDWIWNCLFSVLGISG